MAQLTRLTTLKDFFGYQPGQTLKEFSAECNMLSEPEKDELANAAKAELIRQGLRKMEDFNF